MKTSILATLLAPVLLATTACVNTPPAEEPNFEIIVLEFAEASELAAALNGLSGSDDCKIMADPRTNSLLVMATEDRMPQLKDLVAMLDVEVRASKTR